MKRISLLLLSLMLIVAMTGCCFAPGYEGNAVSEMRLMLPANWESDEEQDVVVVEETRAPITLTAQQQALIANQPNRQSGDFVNVRNYIPDIFVDLKYASSDNIAGKVIYDFDGVYLRYGTVVKLMQVQEELREMGLSLMIWDAFRPVEAQAELWAAYPNEIFVTNPETGTSANSCGYAVDVTVVDADGNQLEMPSEYDSFTSLADRNYGDCTEAAAENATMLQELMMKYGFNGVQTKWYHFEDSTMYSVETLFDPSVISTWYAVCNEYINIRKGPSASTDSIGTIPANAEFTLLGWDGSFAYIEYNGIRGYVNGNYMKPVE